jgi:tetratricopeptide (TPR) repeat protein
MRLRYFSVLCALWLCAFVGAERFAVADDATTKAKELYQQGQAHYAVGEYEAAAEAYQNAYKLKQDPALLFNAAQAQRLAGNLDRALTLYRNYLRFHPNVANRAEVESRISQLEQQIEEARAAKVAPPPTEPAPPLAEGRPLTTTGTTAATTEAPPVLTAVPAPSEPRPLYKRPWVWAVVGGVVATGVVITAIALSSGGGGAWANQPDVREQGLRVAQW